MVGPTGHGKSTTLSAIIELINANRNAHILTIEDPVEYLYEQKRSIIDQREVKIDTKDFNTALRSMFRQDIDVALIGEMRGPETIEAAVTAAETGHLVFSTLHTNSAPETIVRLIDMGMNPFNFADALLGILAQRLVRTLCPKCKDKYHPEKQEFEMLKKEYGEDLFQELDVLYSEGFFLYRPVGCEKCGNSGYLGRTAIHELLVATPEIKRAIVEGATVEEIYKIGRSKGMRTLKQDGIIKVIKGQTDLAEVLKVCIV